jgi:hypothetical protein
MKAGRLSKLQKWILIMAYKKTILHENSELTLLEHWDFRSYSTDKSQQEIHDKESLYWKYLFRSEILLDYFKRETDKGKAGLGSFHRFKGKGNKEQVTLTNSLYNLRDKNLIKIDDGEYVVWQGIKLTQKGIEVAQSLIINPLSILTKC